MSSGQSNLELGGSPAKAEYAVSGHGTPTSVRVTSQFSGNDRKIPANVEVIEIESDKEAIAENLAAPVAPAPAMGLTWGEEAEPLFFFPPKPFHICDSSCYQVGSYHRNGNYVDRHYDADRGLVDTAKVEAEHEEIGRLYEIYTTNLEYINSLLPAYRQLSAGPYGTLPGEGLSILRLVAEQGLDALRPHPQPREEETARRNSDAYRGKVGNFERSISVVAVGSHDSENTISLANLSDDDTKGPATPTVVKSSPKRKALHLPPGKCPNAYDTIVEGVVEYIAPRALRPVKRRRFNDINSRRSRGDAWGGVEAALGSSIRDLSDFDVMPVFTVN